MKPVVLVCAALLASCFPCSATKISLFADTDRFVDRAKDIVVAECTSQNEAEPQVDGFCLASVKVLTVIKGDKKPGDLRVATLYPMKPGSMYMLMSLGGLVHDTDFLTTAELSVIPLPKDFELDHLAGMPVKDQVQQVFSRRQYELERELAPLLKEQSLLEKGLKDRTDNLYESPAELNLGKIHTLVTKNEGGRPHLDVDGRKLLWSHTAPGHSGCFYFATSGSPRPLWEFAASTHTKIEEFQGEQLKAMFYGQYTPGRTEVFRWTGPSTIEVSVGQVVLVRAIDDPSTIYILQLKRQDKEERLFVRYAVVRR